MRSQIVRFLITGSIGFAVDAGCLVALVSLGTDPYAARVLSFLLAITVTWAIHRNWTFPTRNRAQSLAVETTRYALTQGTGAVINYCVFALVLAVLGADVVNALLAVACGSLVATVFNYLVIRRFVF